MKPEQIDRILNKILPTVQRPGRYTGGELNQVVKEWTEERVKVALAFPDIYDLGMSNFGLSIFYDLLNRREDILAERAYLPWQDMRLAMEKESLPLYSLETHHQLSDFDILGITLPYETLYTNALALMALGQIPVFQKDRDISHPLVIAGGHATLNPEPMHAFMDAFVIGEGEEVFDEIVNVYQAWKSSGDRKQSLLEQLSQLQGVYIPSLYSVDYHSDGTVSSITNHDPAPAKVLRRITTVLPPPTTNLIVPYIEVVHNRIPIEIMRGCTRGCRFCHAGFTTRPVRERSVEEILQAIDDGLRNTGYEEIGLLSLSSSDYTKILDLVQSISEKYAGKNLSVSLPSLRIESFSLDLMDALKDGRRGGFTLAPEAATERIRNIINKPLSEEQLLTTAREIFSRGYTTIKLYFMIGHPEETLEDVKAIAELAKAVRLQGLQTIGRRAQVNVGISTFVPKPHTPFQWATADSPEQIHAKQEVLKEYLRGPGLKLNWNDSDETMFEAALSRGDRRIADVIYTAWKNGAGFDAWHEFFDYSRWESAFDEHGLSPDFYTQRPRLDDEIFPWEHISTGVNKAYLQTEYQKSLQGITTIDCRERCFACGILTSYHGNLTGEENLTWMCPVGKAG
ncbi:MAG: TIGR03960 family B12-binding radical SAM protein [Anaerolineales bacterium]|nr:TIGR03960 family B12-binding radical SAM protein [Anaerolineales bacterium]